MRFYVILLATLSGQWLWIPARQCSVTPCKSDATVSTTEHTRLHSCWWIGIIFPRSQSFRLLHLGCPAGFGVRRPTTTVCKSTGPQKGNQKQVKGGDRSDSSKIHCTMGNDWMWLAWWLVSRMEALITVTGYRSHAVRRVELIGYFVPVRFNKSIYLNQENPQNNKNSTEKNTNIKTSKKQTDRGNAIDNRQ